MSYSRFTILVVCTANLCRSPMTQFLLQAAADQHPALAGAWTVNSAGTHAAAGSAMHELADRVLAERGVKHTPFQTHPLTAEAIAAADLVLTATREHRRHVVELVPSALRRTFTLREFSRLAAAIPSSPNRLRDRGDELLTGIPVARSLVAPGQAQDDDLADPMGGRIRVFRRCADAIEQTANLIVGQ